MHKDEIKICVFLAVFAILLLLCFMKKNEINELKKEKESILEKQNEIQKLAGMISAISFDQIITKETLLKRYDDINGVLIKIAQKSHIKAAKLKKKEIKQKYYKEFDMEVKFLAEYEHDIYYFIENLREELNIIFDSVKIIKKSKKNFFVQIECRCFKYNAINKFIDIKSQKRNATFINHLQLFTKDEERKKHFLQGIIDRTRAYIDEEWKQSGDTIGDDCKIKNIYGESILIERNGKSKEVKLGDSW